jgi:hypothetical protein
MAFTHQTVLRVSFLLQNGTSEETMHDIWMRAVKTKFRGMNLADPDVMEQRRFLDKLTLCSAHPHVIGNR